MLVAFAPQAINQNVQNPQKKEKTFKTEKKKVEKTEKYHCGIKKKKKQQKVRSTIACTMLCQQQSFTALALHVPAAACRKWQNGPV
jgi:hypothetical protein